MDNKHVDPSFRPTQDQYDMYLTIMAFGASVGWDRRRLTDEGPFLMADPNIHFVLLRAEQDFLAMARGLGKPQAVLDQIEGWVVNVHAASEYSWNNEVGAFSGREVRTGRFSNGFSNCNALSFHANSGAAEQ